MQIESEAISLPQLYLVPGSAHAARYGDLLYTSGLTARKTDGSIAAKGNFVSQVEKVYTDLAVVLRAAGARWQDVVKVNYYVAPRACTAENRAVLRSVEARHVPAGCCAATGSALDLVDPELLVQVEAIAYLAGRKTIINGVSDVPATLNWVQAVRAGDTLFVSAQLPLAGERTGHANPIRIEGGLGDQTVVAYKHFDRILKAAGMTWEDAVQVHQFLTPPQLSIDEFQKARTTFLTLGRFLSTSVRCSEEHPAWPLQDWLISVDMEADARPRRAIQPVDSWGNPPGPHAFVAGSIMRMHGQVSRNLDRETIHENDPSGQAELIYSNIGRILEASGSGWDRVLHVRNFCKRRGDIPAIKTVQNRHVPAGHAATTDLVADFFDPKLLVETEVVAWTN